METVSIDRPSKKDLGYGLKALVGQIAKVVKETIGLRSCSPSPSGPQGKKKKQQMASPLVNPAIIEMPAAMVVAEEISIGNLDGSTSSSEEEEGKHSNVSLGPQGNLWLQYRVRQNLRSAQR